MKLTSAELVTHFSNSELTKWQKQHADHSSTFGLSSILLTEMALNHTTQSLKLKWPSIILFNQSYYWEVIKYPQSTQLLIRAEMCPAIEGTFKWMNLSLWDRMKIGYTKQNANQLSGELVSLVFNRAMEQTSKERAPTDTTESL